jgi:hypothetical protein
MANLISRSASTAFVLAVLLASLTGTFARQLRGDNDDQVGQAFTQEGPRAREYMGKSSTLCTR